MSGSIDEPFVPRRKKVSVLWWIAGFFFLLLVLFFFQLFGPNPRIVVSKQTTFITAPLGPDGLPNYEQYLLNTAREGVTPENNAVTLLWQALFPADVPTQDVPLVAAELGLDEVPSADEALVAFYSDANRQRVKRFISEKSQSAEEVEEGCQQHGHGRGSPGSRHGTAMDLGAIAADCGLDSREPRAAGFDCRGVASTALVRSVPNAAQQ